MRLLASALAGRPAGFGGQPAAPTGAAPPGTAPTGAAPTGAAAAGTAAGSPVNLTVGTTVTATLLQPFTASSGGTSGRGGPGATPGAPTAPGAAGTAQGVAQARQGTPAAAGRTTSPSPPAGTVTTGAPRVAGAAGVGASVSGTPGVAAPADGGTALPAGTQVSVRVIALQPPGPAGATNSPLSSPSGTLAGGTVLTATVTGGTASGQPIVQTAAGTLALNTRTPLPTGGIVTLEVTETPAAPRAAEVAAAPGFRREILIDGSWTSLKEAVTAVFQADPVAAQQLVGTVIPRADAQLAANILSFLAALRGGDVRAWLGEGPGRVLERNRPNLSSRLGDEFRQIGRMAEEPISGDWRIALVPFNTGTDIEQIRLFMRRHGAKESDDGGKGGTRFIVDVNLSRLGRMQFDGLVRAEPKRFDLIVRSTSALPAEMRDDIRQLFRESSEITGIRGGVSFQCAPPGFTEVAPQAVIAGRLGLIA